MRVNTMSRDAGLKVVDFVLKFPDKATDMWDFAQQLQKRMGNNSGEQESWSNQYTRIWRIGGDWRLEWILFASKGTIEKDDLLYFYHRDEKLIKQFAYFLTGLHGQCKLPTNMLRKQVASRVFCEMARARGRMQILGNKLKNRASMDFVAISPYHIEFHPETGLAVSILHSGDTAVTVPGLQFPRSWKLSDPLSDHDCAALEPQGKGSHELKKFFAAGQGPFKTMPEHNGFNMEEAAAKYHEQISKQQEMSKIGELTVDIEKQITPEKLEAKRAGLERARNAVRAKRAKLEVGLEQNVTTN